MEGERGEPRLVVLLLYNDFASSSGKILAEAQSTQIKIKILDIVETIYFQNLTGQRKKHTLYKLVTS